MANRFLDRPGEKLSELIQKQLPSFVRQDHPKIIAFLEAYYEWLDQQAQPVGGAKRILLEQDIDSTLDEFVVFFKREFLPRIPDQALADKRKILKNIKQFYRARGTEKSFKFLFRILFDSDVEFRFPGRDMLRASDGKWIKDTSIKVTPANGDTDPYDFEGRTVRGLTSGAFAVVEVVRAKEITDGFFVHELYLNRASLRGVFEAGEEIANFDLNVQGDLLANVEFLVTDIILTNPGDGYAIGDVITIDSVDNQGVEARASVLAIDPTDLSDPLNPTGIITKIVINDFGAGYTIPPIVTFPSPIPPFDALPSNTATGIAVIGGMTDYPGFFLNADGKLSDFKFLQDSFFFQKFSYVLIVSESIDFYRDVVKELLHPAGLILFGQFQHTDEIDVGVQVPLNASEVTLNIMTELDVSLQGIMTFFDLDIISDIQRVGNFFNIDNTIEFQNPNIIFSSDPETAKCLSNFAKPGMGIQISNNSGNDGCYNILSTVYDVGAGTISIIVDSFRDFLLDITMAGGGTGDYVYGERVYQGTNRLIPDAFGYVDNWDPIAEVLKINTSFGTFNLVDPIIGDTFGASHIAAIVGTSTTFNQGRLGFTEFPHALPLGLSVQSLEKNKFAYLPSEQDPNPPVSTFDNPPFGPGSPVPGEDSTEMFGVNSGYWDTFANTQIGHFDSLIIGDVEDKSWTPINTSAAPVLKSTF